MIIDLREFFSKPVFGFCFPTSTVCLGLGFVVYCSSERLLCSQLCLCLSAGVNVHRHANGLRLSVTLSLSPCEPGFCSVMTLCISQAVYFHLHTTLFAGSNIVYLLNMSLICCYCGNIAPHDVLMFPVCPLRVNSSVNCPNIQVFHLQLGQAQPRKVHLFPFSILSRVCAVSFVLCLQGGKAGSTMVPVWALTIAILNGSERGETRSFLCSKLSFF